MGIGKQNNDDRFYKGYEGEPELILSSDEKSIHIWDGYMEDIFGNPVQNEDGWYGFTRDYNEFVGPYEDNCIEVCLNLDEYIKDAEAYVGKKFEYEESSEVLKTIIDFLRKSYDDGKTVMVSLK